MLSSRVTEFRPREAPVPDSSERLRADLEKAIAYGVQSLNGEIPLDLAAWPNPQLAELRYQTTGLIRRFDKEQRRLAELRAREAVASSGFGGDYSVLQAGSQNRINQIVRQAIQSYEMHLQGISSPLASSRAAELSPERNRS